MYQWSPKEVLYITLVAWVYTAETSFVCGRDGLYGKLIKW